MSITGADEAPLAVLRRWSDRPDRDLLDPEVAWVVSPGYPVPRQRWTGPEDVFDGFFPALRANVAGWALTVDAMLPVWDDVVVARGAYHATPRGADAPVDIPFLHLWTVRGSRIVAVDAVADFAPLRRDARAG